MIKVIREGTAKNSSNIRSICSRLVRYNKSKDEPIEDSSRYNLEINDSESIINDLLAYIKGLADAGHSFDVIVDPDNKDTMRSFSINNANSNKSARINESSGIIESGSQEFGKPGTYIVYRNGSHQTKRGFISFSDTSAGADKYAKDGSKTEKFSVTINNPYVSKGNTSIEAFKSAYKDLLGSEPEIDPNKEKINDTWRKCDSAMAKYLLVKGYDSLIYLVPQANEVNVIGADIDKMPNINEFHESVPQALGT